MINNPAHAIGLVGDRGVGKTYAATVLAARLLQVDEAKLDNHPFFRIIQPEKGAIGIEQSREITSFLKLKTTGTERIRRIVLIEHAGSMTHEAQNAVLKFLEEPPEDTVIILTLNSSQDVLQTILSRIQVVSLLAPTGTELSDHLKRNGYSESKVQSAILMSGGLPGLTYGIVNNEDSHELVHGIAQAKKFIAGDMFERLVMIDEIIKNKQTAVLIDGLLRISDAALQASGKRGGAHDVLRRWHDIAQVTLTAKQQLTQHGQPKLVMTNLAVSII